MGKPQRENSGLATELQADLSGKLLMIWLVLLRLQSITSLYSNIVRDSAGRMVFFQAVVVAHHSLQGREPVTD